MIEIEEDFSPALFGALDYANMTPKDLPKSVRCGIGYGGIAIKFGRNVEYEIVRASKSTDHISKYMLQEDTLIKQVDLFSGIGGTLGLFLGWSVMTLGDLIVQFAVHLINKFDKYCNKL